MRKFMKKSILEIFQTMYEAHRNIKLFIEKKNFENANIILGDCQNTAIQIGEAIESSEGEGFVTVSYLEEYCEAVYEVSASISDNYNGNKAQKVLDKLLIKVENSVRNDIKVRLEIVFCPYKASMWDSLESVWKAADEDPDCDAYVVPIPYYDRNPDYSFGGFHYEGGDYPDYVHITHYEAYNFETRRPDVVYIHNPYDECNYVTSVDPRFYSSELKKYTEKLVYIPYFVVDDSRRIDKIEHYALSPAVINSDIVVVQSEKVRQKYMAVLLPHYGNTLDAKHMLENKILGLGSPKFDALIHSKPEFSSLPEEWQKKIGDCSKKIILYNTHLSMLMAGDYEKSLIKLEQVLRYFKSRDDIVLLWRPHPLTIPTVKSTNPIAFEPYMQIVEKYKSEKWGIYDDSPDMDRAIALSDAYYGSESSVVPIFKETGKPVLIQNIRCNNMKKNEIFRISPSAFCVVGDDIWMFHSMMNLLVKYNTVSKTTEIIGQLDGEENIRGTLISDMFYTNGQLIMIPCWANSFHTYNIQNHCFTKIEFEKDNSVNGLFINSLRVGEKIYCVPFKSNCIVVFDMASQSIINCIDIRSQIQRNYDYINNACLINDETIAFVTVDSYINFFSLKTNKVESIFCGIENAKLTRIECCNNMIFIVDMEHNTLNKWNAEGKKISVISSEKRYFSIFATDSKIVLDFEKEFKIYDICKNCFEDMIERSLSEYNNSLDPDWMGSLFIESEGCLYEFDRYAAILYITKNGVKTEHHVQLTFDELKKFASGKFLIESELYGLDEMIKAIDLDERSNTHIHELSGKKIYSFVRSLL
ncbi:MAG: hypothetical protein ACI4I2_11010 [Oscillospiraceae bacterium]